MTTQQTLLPNFNPLKTVPNKTLYGVNTFNPPNGSTAHTTNVNACVAIGAKVIRTGLVWAAVQTTVGGSYDWSVYDDIYAKATAAGITCIFAIETTPKAYNLQPYGFFASLPLASGIFAIPVVTDPTFTQLCTDYATFAAAVAVRYPLALLEISNEWATASGFWMENNDPLAKPTVSAYGQYFMAAYTAIKAVSPNSVVAVGGLTAVTFWSGANATVGVNVPALLTAISGFTCDAWSIHPYTRGAVSKDPRWVNNPVRANSFDDIGAFRTAQIAAGQGSKPLWVTEYLDWGVSESTGGNAAIDGAQLTADGLYSTLRQVHNLHGKGAVGATNAGVTICCMYPLQDVTTSTPADSGMYTGDANGVITQKKSGAAFQQFTASLPAYTP